VLLDYAYRHQAESFQLKARINGFQFVLVGDVQEMPFVHLSTSEFVVLINDWSGDVG
jgi:vacuolar protein sorting-associated protein 13A/C